jgi:putative DNA primase/helicase
MRSISEILRELGIAPPPPGKDRYYTTCPQCSAKRSRAHQKAECLGVTITDEGVLFGCNHCNWKGGKRFVNGRDRVQPRQGVVAEFPYQDEGGNILFVVERSESSARNEDGKPSKTIRQKRPDPKQSGKWIWNVKDVPVVPYRLPQLTEAIGTERPIFIVEGEPKVDLLLSWNVAATCNAGGAKKWKPEHAEYLRGADVVLMPDNDDAGWQHINAVGVSLVGIAKRIRVLVLPHAKPKDDVVDWAKNGGTREQLDALLDRAQDWRPLNKVDQRNDEEKAKAKAHEDELLDALAKAEGLDYARKRKAAAQELDVPARDIDAEIRIRREDNQVAPLYGHWIIEPWPEPCDGDCLLRDIINRIKRQVVIIYDSALASALFLMLAWVHDEIATHSPILNINSAEPESGKTTLIGLISFLMPRCIASVEASEAAIYRAIKRWSPSFCFDEFDSILADDDKAALRSVINSGHTRGQGVLRCIGDDKVPELFLTFAPKVIGMVGRKLPPATLSRCIFVELRRCRKDERFEKFNHVDDTELADLRRRLLRWSMDSAETLRNASVSIPDELPNRRADNWRLQFAIADLAGGEWGDKARAAAIAIEGKADSRSIGVRLLTDIKALFDADPEAPCMHSATMVAGLIADPEKPWAELTRGKPLTQNRLAKFLGTYRIISQNVKPPGMSEAKGYYRSQFEDVWSCYVV